MTTLSSPDHYRQMYANAACTPPESLKSSDAQLASHVTVSSASKQLFYIIDVLRVPADKCDRTSPGAIRTAIENEFRIGGETLA